MLSKVNILGFIGSRRAIVIFLCCLVGYGSAIFNQPFINQNNFLPNRGFLTPPRAVTTLNTFVPRRLIPSAPPRPPVPRVYENSQRVYTAPPILRPIPPAPTTRRPLAGSTNNTPRYAFNYGVNDIRVNTRSNYRMFPRFNHLVTSPPSFYCSCEICTSFHAFGLNFKCFSFFKTGDIKNVQERLENGVVTGSYSLTEPDGSIRTVTYTADDINGFNAVVERTNPPVTIDTNNINNSQFTIFT